MRIAVLMVSSFACAAYALDLDELIDQVDSQLTFSSPDYDLRARVSGTLDNEFYHFNQPSPGLIDARSDNLFNPRLTLFLDGQLGSKIYFFAQSRLDRGFDPTDQGAQIRADEYAIRVTPWEDGRFNIQVGKFATVVGNWVSRHLSWDNPFVNAPLVYENVTGISDKVPPVSKRDFLTGFNPIEKYEYNPVIWGPSYTSGISVSGRVEQFDYAVEMKNASLSSRPSSWNITTDGFDRPALDGRIGFRPAEPWNFGLSAAGGWYSLTQAEPTLPLGRDIYDYHQFLIGQDASFAWHHLQLWAECYEARFEVPHAGNADTLAYYLEAKYKFTPQLFGALRWNQQIFNTIDTGHNSSGHWSPDLVRLDLAAGYRFTAHTQLKLQYSFQQETSGAADHTHLFAAQFTVRF